MEILKLLSTQGPTLQRDIVQTFKNIFHYKDAKGDSVAKAGISAILKRMEGSRYIEAEQIPNDGAGGIPMNKWSITNEGKQELSKLK